MHLKTEAIPTHILEDIQDAFDYYDTNKTGQISQNDAKAIITGMLFTPFTRRQLDETVADMISEEMINYETLLLLLAHFIDKSYDTESKHMFK